MYMLHGLRAQGRSSSTKRRRGDEDDDDDDDEDEDAEDVIFSHTGADSSRYPNMFATVARSAHYSMPEVDAFSVPFNVSAHSGRLWIKPWWGGDASAVELHIKGVNWFGTAGSRRCMEEINRVRVQQYIDFMVTHSFNAVRLPLSVATILANPILEGPVWPCGEYAGWSHLRMLANVIQRLATAGLFVMLDMHTLTYPEHNQPLWCEVQNATVGCTVGVDDPHVDQPATLQPLLRAWARVAETFCAHRNVILADVYNEPYGGHWGPHADYPVGTDWALAAETIGNHILSRCPRWLIAVEGIANNEPTHVCSNVTNGSWCWWGEDVLGQLTRPIALAVPDRLVLSPHAYGYALAS